MNQSRAQTGAQPYIILETPKGLIVGDPSLCVDCQRCEMACTEFNDGKNDPVLARIRIGRNIWYGPGNPGARPLQGVWGDSTVYQDNTEEVPEDTTAVNSEPETATIVEVTSETVNLTETPEQAASEIEDKKTTEDTTGDIMTLIGKLDYPEITAFDYELEHLPELKPEDQEVATEENTDIPEIQEELPEKKGKQNLPPALDVELID